MTPEERRQQVNKDIVSSHGLGISRGFNFEIGGFRITVPGISRGLLAGGIAAQKDNLEGRPIGTTKWESITDAEILADLERERSDPRNNLMWSKEEI